MNEKKEYPWSMEVAPTVTVGDRGAEISEHPAFGLVRVSAPSGGLMVLNGSDFKHHRCISIEVYPARQVRDLSHTWHMEVRRPLIKFDMSEAQFVRMVASQGTVGTPCTIRFADGEHKPRIKMDDHTTDKFSREMRAALDGAFKAIDEAMAALDEGGNAKQRKKAQDALENAKRNLSGSAPFVADSFDNHMDKVADDAKTEAHAHLNRAMMEAGIKTSRLEDKREEAR